jgi:hypothetical protein
VSRSLSVAARAAERCARAWVAGTEPSDEQLAQAEAGIGPRAVALLELLVQERRAPHPDLRVLIAEGREHVHRDLASGLEELADAVAETHARTGGEIHHAEVSACVRPISARDAGEGTVGRYAGIWKQGGDYRPGDLATHRGALWFCRSASGEKPGTDASWTLMHKSLERSR